MFVMEKIRLILLLILSFTASSLGRGNARAWVYIESRELGKGREPRLKLLFAAESKGYGSRCPGKKLEERKGRPSRYEGRAGGPYLPLSLYRKFHETWLLHCKGTRLRARPFQGWKDVHRRSRKEHIRLHEVQELKIPVKINKSWSNPHAFSFYFYAYFHAAYAGMELPLRKRKSLLKNIENDNPESREPGSTWFDRFFLGKVYGISMALLVIDMEEKGSKVK